MVLPVTPPRPLSFNAAPPPCGRGGGGGWHKASVSDCLPLAAPIGLSPLLILTLCGPERVLVGGGCAHKDRARLPPSVVSVTQPSPGSDSVGSSHF